MKFFFKNLFQHKKEDTTNQSIGKIIATLQNNELESLDRILSEHFRPNDV